MVWTLLGSIAAVITTLGFVPQILKMWRTQSVGDVSALTFYQFLVGSMLWTAYSIHLGDPVLIIPNGFMLALLGVAIGLHRRLSRMARSVVSLSNEDDAGPVPSVRNLQ
ncbi:MAG: hypothetical protein EXR48_04995 [Dehalococcoidia bacterium]|nr:hypothetical protein [Dehalococcoidia bacterium]